ncbi:MAG TPA: response regulator [Candidatus Sulfotelmatobacter sp.]|nr:response regulator [Candidatus Sulfotelmatobacter sp.]
MAGERILVVEDELLIARMVQECLAPLYVEVVHVTSGPQALEAVLAHPPDLILLDVVLPGIDGFEVARRIKSDPKTGHLPIIFLTALSQATDKARGFELGADDYITKPFQFEEVQARVRRALQRAEAARALRAAEAGRGIRGRLRDMGLPSLIQFIELERAGGVLSLTRGEERGHIYFDGGRIVNAVLRGTQGEHAVYRLLAWDDGEFELERVHGGTAFEGRIAASNQALLLEGLCRRDERARLKAALPPMNIRLAASERLRHALQGKKPAADLQRYLPLLDGTRTIQQVVDESGEDDLKALVDLAKLYRSGMLEPGGTP